MADPESIWEALIGTPTVGSTSDYTATQEVNLYHELGPQLENQTAEAVVDIDETPTRVVFKSHVITRGAKALRSPHYLATIRRRGARMIAALIEALATHVQSEEFAVWTHEPLEKLRGLIYRLTEAEEFSDPEHEGNSCEILRQLRDTFLNAGWERYREPAVRDAAVSILQRLAAADEVSADDAYSAMDQLLDLDLDPSVGIVWQDDEEEEVPH